MSEPHVIRLRAPWELQPADSAGERWSLRRRFNAPTGISTGEAVWLVLDDVRAALAVVLNSEPLALRVDPAPHWEADLTRRLALHNQLQFEFSIADGAGQFLVAGRGDLPSTVIGGVHLEIRQGENRKPKTENRKPKTEN